MADRPRLASESIAGRRPYQEDAVLTETLSDGRIVVAVADGMGGHAAGEVASAEALESLVEALEDGETLEGAFHLANRRVHSRAREPGKQGMGTTLVVMVLDGDAYHVANVGDSRGYLLDGIGIRRITRDHSFVAEAVEHGQSEEEAKASQWKDALTRSIGTDTEVEVDVFGPFSVEQDSAVLLCSDGLYKVMDDERIRALYVQSGGPTGAAQSLVATALEDGSDDNISVAVAEFGEIPRDRPAGTMELEYEPRDDDGDEGVDTTAAGDDPSSLEEEAPAGETAVDVRPGASKDPRGRTGLPPGVVVAAVVILLAAAIGFVLFAG